MSAAVIAAAATVAVVAVKQKRCKCACVCVFSFFAKKLMLQMSSHIDLCLTHLKHCSLLVFSVNQSESQRVSCNYCCFFYVK